MGPSCAKLRLALAARVGCWLMPLQSYSSDPKYLHGCLGLLPTNQDAWLIGTSTLGEAVVPGRQLQLSSQPALGVRDIKRLRCC